MTQAHPRKKILVNCRDFDGHFAHPNNASNGKITDVFKSNEQFFKNEYKEIQENDYKIVYFSCGSMRQCKDTEEANRKKTVEDQKIDYGYCLPFFDNLILDFRKLNSVGESKIDKIEFKLFKGLMGDIGGKEEKELGTTFDEALRAELDILSLECQTPRERQSSTDRNRDNLIRRSSKSKSSSRNRQEEKQEKKQYDYSWELDQSKLTILYFQMHEIAFQHPDDEITFDFSDDADKVVLEPLLIYFQKNPWLMPSNVNIRLRHYVCNPEGNSKVLGSIQGTGPIDENYFQNIKLMNFYKNSYIKNANLIPDIVFERFKKNRNLFPKRSLVQEINKLGNSLNDDKDKKDEKKRDQKQKAGKIFFESLKKLSADLKSEMSESQNPKYFRTETSIANHTVDLLKTMRSPVGKNEKIIAIKKYEKSCKKTSKFVYFAKAVGTVVCAGIGLVLGMGLGLLLAKFSAGQSLFHCPAAGWNMGLAAGAKIMGLTLGGGVGGSVGAIASGYSLFTPRKSIVDPVVEAGQRYALVG